MKHSKAIENETENILNWIILYPVLFLPITHAVITEQVKTTSGYCMQNNNALRIYGLSWTGCKDECTFRSDCTSISYYARMRRCRLYNDSVAMDIEKCPGVVHAKRGYWIEVQNCPAQCDPGMRCNNITGKCQTTECSTPPDVPGYSRKGNQRTVGSKMLYICPSHVTEDTVTCLANGSWSFISKCEVDCGAPRVQTGYTAAAGGTTEGSTRVVTCSTGYSGSPPDIQCEASGTWTAYFGCFIGGNVGDSCNFNVVCLDPNSRCINIHSSYTGTVIYGKCLCYNNTEFNASTGTCDTHCAGYTTSDTFMKVEDTYIRYYDSAKYYHFSVAKCTQKCRNFEWCLSFDYWSNKYASVCFLHQVTLQQVEDGDKANIKQSYSYDLYVRQCQSLSGHP